MTTSTGHDLTLFPRHPFPVVTTYDKIEIHGSIVPPSAKAPPTKLANYICLPYELLPPLQDSNCMIDFVALVGITESELDLCKEQTVLEFSKTLAESRGDQV